MYSMNNIVKHIYSMYSVLEVKNTACQSKLMTIPKGITLTLLSYSKEIFFYNRASRYLSG